MSYIYKTKGTCSTQISVAASCKLYVMYYISIEVKLNLC